jgi:hypothetical protein
MQYTPATSETGKALSRAMGSPGLNVADFSPIQFDQYVKGWTGSLGGLALKALDLPFHDVKKPWEVNDIPFVGSFFTRNPGMSAQPIQDFYHSMDDLEAKSNDFKLAMKRAENGNASEIDHTSPYAGLADTMKEIKDTIAVQSHVIQGIASNKDMTDKEKRQAVDALMPQIIGTAKQGVQAVDEVKKQAAQAAKGGDDTPLPGTTPPPAPAAPGGQPAGRADGGAAPPPVPLPGANRGEVPIA